jgi:signal transduction histidine kinase
VAVELGASSDRWARRVSLPFSGVAGLAIGLLLSLPTFHEGNTTSVIVERGWGYPGIVGIIIGWTVAILVTAVGFWFIGFGIRAWRGRIASEQRQVETEKDLAVAELELRVASERDRIAQDVHDIMAHSLSVIIAQADGARYLGEAQPRKSKELQTTNSSLAAIAQSARESLVEVRMLIDSLGAESDGHSHPTLAEIDALVERMQSAGLAVTLSTFGDAGELTAGQELAVYRIVQESLTNALKHGGAGAAASVVFDWRGPGLALTVSSVGSSPGAAPTESLTRGIRGMTERARLAGGWLAAGPDDEDAHRFIVTAFIPVAAAVALSPSPQPEIAR